MTTAAADNTGNLDARRRTELSATQRRVFDMIREHLATIGYPPTMQEISDATGLKSLASVTYQLQQLELAGYIKRNPGRARGLADR